MRKLFLFIMFTSFVYSSKIEGKIQKKMLEKNR